MWNKCKRMKLILNCILVLCILKCCLICADRISAKMCQKYRQNIKFEYNRNVVRGITYKFPYKVRSVKFVGILISENFVLVLKDNYLSHYNFHYAEILLENGTQIDVAITRYFTKRFSENRVFHLLQLNEHVKFHSKLFPACLWNPGIHMNDTFYFHRTKIIFPYDTHGYAPTRRIHNIVPVEECRAQYDAAKTQTVKFMPEFYDGNRATCGHVAFDNSNFIYKFFNEMLSITQIAFTDEDYLYGIGIINMDRIPGIREHKGLDVITYRVEPFIEWIERVVWFHMKCGQRLQARRTITHGYETDFGEFPWHVAISSLHRNGIKIYLCGGSIVGTNTILTAAHCIDNPNIQLVIEAGLHILDHPTEYTKIYYPSHLFTHENYTKGSSYHDIGIIRLNASIDYSTFIQPICLTGDETIFKYQIGRMPSWGTTENGTHSNTLLEATFPMHEKFYCKMLDVDFYARNVNEYNFCAGFANGTSLCSGDSGSGLIVMSSNNWYLRGIAAKTASNSRTKSQCNHYYYGIFTDVVKHYDWIISKMSDDLDLPYI